MRFALSRLLGALLGLLAAAPASAAGLTAAEKAAALHEGTVVWYTQLSTLAAQNVAAAAQQALGIKIELTRLGSTQIFNRILLELQQKVPTADVVNTNVVSQFIALKKQHALQAFTPGNIGLYRNPQYYDPDHTWHALGLSLGTIQYNTDRLKGDAIPKTWKDLLKPEYAGQVMQGDPRAGGGSTTIAYFLTKLYGWSFFQQLKQNRVLTNLSCDGTNLLESGERLLVMCDHQLTPPAQAKGLPINTIFPADGVFVSLMPIAMLASATHPNAAKLFIDWCLSPPGQQLLANVGAGPVLDSPDIKWPAQYPPLSAMKLMVADQQDFDNWLPQMKKEWADIFGG